jgi:hypothetical protein
LVVQARREPGRRQRAKVEALEIEGAGSVADGQRPELPQSGVQHFT